MLALLFQDENMDECPQGDWFVPYEHCIYNSQSSYLAANLRRSVEPGA